MINKPKSWFSKLKFLPTMNGGSKEPQKVGMRKDTNAYKDLFLNHRRKYLYNLTFSYLKKSCKQVAQGLFYWACTMFFKSWVNFKKLELPPNSPDFWLDNRHTALQCPSSLLHQGQGISFWQRKFYLKCESERQARRTRGILLQLSLHSFSSPPLWAQACNVLSKWCG